MNVIVVESDKYETLKGYCFMSCQSTYTVINTFLPEPVKRIVAAHELGHIILHRHQLKMAPMKDSVLYDMTSQTEYEANMFAADLLIDDDDIHTLSKEDMDEECQRYETLIEQNPIDIQILGIGMDGHIAYNEPGSPLDGACHVVDLHQESIESSLDYGFDHIEDVPTQGVTQGIGTIMKAKQLIMMAKGEKKADLVKRMIYGEVTSDFPSSIIQRHPNVIACLDQEAASKLKEEDYEKR